MPAAQPHPGRLRSLGAAGAGCRSQRAASRLAQGSVAARPRRIASTDWSTSLAVVVALRPRCASAGALPVGAAHPAGPVALDRLDDLIGAGRRSEVDEDLLEDHVGWRWSRRVGQRVGRRRPGRGRNTARPGRRRRTGRAAAAPPRSRSRGPGGRTRYEVAGSADGLRRAASGQVGSPVQAMDARSLASSANTPQSVERVDAVLQVGHIQKSARWRRRQMADELAAAYKSKRLRRRTPAPGLPAGEINAQRGDRRQACWDVAGLGAHDGRLVRSASRAWERASTSMVSLTPAGTSTTEARPSPEEAQRCVDGGVSLQGQHPHRRRPVQAEASSTSHPTSLPWCRPAARPTVLAAWAPVTSPNDASSGRPREVLETRRRRLSSAIAAAGDEVLLKAFWSQPAASMSAQVAESRAPPMTNPEVAGPRRGDQRRLGRGDEPVDDLVRASPASGSGPRRRPAPCQDRSWDSPGRLFGRGGRIRAGRPRSGARGGRDDSAAELGGVDVLVQTSGAGSKQVVKEARCMPLLSPDRLRRRHRRWYRHWRQVRSRRCSR